MTTWNSLAAALSLCLAPFAGGGAHADTSDDYRLSGPAVHGNLAIYFVHGQSRGGPIPLTLAEALAKKTIEVREIGEVNELQVENKGAEEIFIQAGDIVKGGQQDRVLSVSLVLKPHSGPLKIASFCVEQGRWSARGSEDVAKFSSANAALPSRAAKVEMAGVPAKIAGGDSATVGKRQQEIRKKVTEIQGKLSSSRVRRSPPRPRAPACSWRWRTAASSARKPNTSRSCSRSARRTPTSSATCSRSTARSTAPISIPPTACSGRCGPAAPRQRDRGAGRARRHR